MDSYKIAVASSDGIVVNQHFGHCSEFHIYEADKNGNFKKAEIRKLTPVCRTGEHDDDLLSENMRKLSDCKYLLVLRIGAGAAAMAEHFGITPMELPLTIECAINKTMAYDEIQNLFERN